MDRPTNCTGVHAIAQACDYTANDHLRDAKSSALKSSTDAQNDTSKHDTFASAEFLSKDQTKDGAEEAADLVDGYDCTLKGRATTSTIGGVDLRKSSCEGVSGQQSRHDSLICHIISY